jgi:hypothetical protein
LENRSRFSKPCFLAGLPLFDDIDFISRHFEPQTELSFQRNGIVFAQCSRLEQLVFVKLRDGRALLNFCVQIGLSKRGFVAFVVAVAAIAIHVDHYVAPESLAKIERHITNKFNRQRIVAVHMKNRRLDHLCDIGGVR